MLRTKSAPASSWQFLPPNLAPKGACQQCVLPPPPPLSDDLPPFVWPRTASEIEGLAQGVEIDFTTTMDKVAAVSDADASVETVLRPLMGAPHYKTNKAVIEAKFLQHCSTDASVRAAADKAGALRGSESQGPHRPAHLRPRLRAGGEKFS